MGKPTAVENVSLERLKTLAERLENGTANDRDRDEALGTTLKMFAAERELGLVSMDEFERHVRDCPALRIKSTTWNAAKGWTIFGSVLTACGTVFGIFYMALN